MNKNYFTNINISCLYLLELSESLEDIRKVVEIATISVPRKIVNCRSRWSQTIPNIVFDQKSAINVLIT